jgi:hypothetical protein
MSGTMAAVAGNGQNIVYTAGLYGPTGVDQSPISDSDSDNNTAFTRTWIGYYKPATTGSVSFGLTTVWSSDDGSNGQYSTGYVWVGNVAKSGYSSGNAVLNSNNSTGSGSISLVAGQYYPIRIQWSAYLPYDFSFFSSYTTNGSMSFSGEGSTTVTGKIFYNSLTNGF